MNDILNEKPLEKLVTDGGFAAIFRKYCCIGDSLSSGEFEYLREDCEKRYYDYFEHSWGQYLARMCGSEALNFSRGGMTAEEYCESFAENKGFWDKSLASQAYILALGVNDINSKKCVGSIEDIDFENYDNNKKSFAGYYGKIIQHMKEIEPNAKFFLMTMPRENDTEERDKLKREHRALLKAMAERFTNTYVIDLYEYAPIYDESFKSMYYLYGHLNLMGYVYTAKLVVSYIDYIVRHDPDSFKYVGFIGKDMSKHL